MKQTTANNFKTVTVFERTVNIAPHIVLSLQCGWASTDKGTVAASRLMFRNYATLTDLSINHNNREQVLAAFRKVLELETADQMWRSVSTPQFDVVNTSHAVGIASRQGKWDVITRFNYVVGLGKRSIVKPLQELIEHFEYLATINEKWLRQELTDIEGDSGDITAPHVFSRTVHNIIDGRQRTSTSIVAFSGTSHQGKDGVGIFINSPQGRLTLTDYVHDFGPQVDDIYSRPVPFILDRLAEGMTILLDQPTKFGTITAAPLPPQFEGWQNSNAYVSHNERQHMVMNVDQYPRYSKAGWLFNYTHLTGVYTAMRELLDHYPQN